MNTFYMGSQKQKLNIAAWVVWASFIVFLTLKDVNKGQIVMFLYYYFGTHIFYMFDCSQTLVETLAF